MSELSSTCSFVMIQINALLDNELDEETADMVREHLSVCENCVNEIEIWTTIRKLVKQAYAPTKPPQSLVDRVSAHCHRLAQAPA